LKFKDLGVLSAQLIQQKSASDRDTFAVILENPIGPQFDNANRNQQA